MHLIIVNNNRYESCLGKFEDDLDILEIIVFGFSKRVYITTNFYKKNYIAYKFLTLWEYLRSSVCDEHLCNARFFLKSER